MKPLDKSPLDCARDLQRNSPSFNLLHARYLRLLRCKNFSARTIETADYNLDHLKRFLDEKRLHPLKAKARDLREFQGWLMNQPRRQRRGGMRGIANVNRVMSNVKGFFRFLNAEGCRRDDPSEKVEYAKEPKSLPRNVLTPQEAKRIIDGVDISTSQGYRDRTVLEVFYATGIRRNELLNLRVADVNLEEGLLRINEGKGGRDRVVPLSAMALKFLESYIKGIRPQLLKRSNTARLFTSFRGNPLDKDTVAHIVKKHAKLAGVEGKVTPHVWRHTLATHLLKNNANLRHVQAMLGHKSLATTERYLHLTITDLKAAHRKCHPRERNHRDAQSRSAAGQGIPTKVGTGIGEAHRRCHPRKRGAGINPEKGLWPMMSLPTIQRLDR